MARTIAKYDILAVPVVDAQHHLVGIVTHDDGHRRAGRRGHRRLPAPRCTTGEINESVRTAGIVTL